MSLFFLEIEHWVLFRTYPYHLENSLMKDFLNPIKARKIFKLITITY